MAQGGAARQQDRTMARYDHVCEDLVAEEIYLDPDLANRGRRGALPSAGHMTETPGMFAAVIDGGGWSETAEHCGRQNGYGEEHEWGAINDPVASGPQDIDQLQSVKDARLSRGSMTTGTATRASRPPVAEMAARLQAATEVRQNQSCCASTLTRDTGCGSTRTKQDREAAGTTRS